MFYPEEKFVQLRTFLQKCHPNHFHSYCEELRQLVDNTPISGKIYGTFYINKETKERTKSIKVAGTFDRCRTINYPRGDVKILTKMLNEKLCKFTMQIGWIQGFNPHKSIFTNVIYHAEGKPKHLLNADLENAFGQITYKNLKEFAEKVLLFNSQSARKFAKIMTYKGRMVQGNPCSPVLLNILAIPMDLRIAGLARKLGMRYTRYADDITISSPQYITKSLKSFIETIITKENWKVNPSKTKLYRELLEVTGIKISEYGKTRKTIRKRTVKTIVLPDGTTRKAYKDYKNDLRMLKHLKSKGVTELKRDDETAVVLDAVISGIYAWLYPDFEKIKERSIEKWLGYLSKHDNKNTRYWKKKYRRKSKSTYLTDRYEIRFQSTELRVLQLHRLEKSRHEKQR